MSFIKLIVIVHYWNMLSDKKHNVRASFAERPQKRTKPHCTPHCWTIDEVDKFKEFYELFGNDPTKISEAFAAPMKKLPVSKQCQTCI